MNEDDSPLLRCSAGIHSSCGDGFPRVRRRSSNRGSLGGAEAQQPDVPTAASFADEALDFVLFPEGYILASDRQRVESLRKLASDLDAPLLVGAIDSSVDAFRHAWQVLRRFDPDGSRSRLYAKYPTGDAVAFEPAILRMGGLTRVGWNLRAFVCAVGTRCGVIGRLLTRYPGGRGVWQRQ